MTTLTENWSEIKQSLTEGLNNEQSELVGQLLENQRTSMLSESAAAGTTSAHDIAGYRKAALPMIRRIIPGTIATELVGVQAMKGPVDQAFSMRFRYTDPAAKPADATRNPFGAPDVVAGNEAFGNDSPLRNWYSGGQGANAPAGSNGVTSDANGEPLYPDTATGQAWGSSKGVADTSTFGPYGPNAIGQTVAGSLHGGSGSNNEGTGGRRMSLEIVSQAVEAGTRRLQSGWTVEAMQDAKNQHNINIETEMTKAVSAEIVSEIDGEILSDLLALAGTTATFNGAGGGGYGASTAAGNYTPAYVGDRLANLGVVINRVANEIARKTRRGAGNFIVVSPMIVSVLQSASGSIFSPAVKGSFKGPNNSMLVGTLNGTIKVYSYLWNQAGAGVDMGVASAGNNDTILVGYKGNSMSDVGYIYCPYIPLTSSGVITHPTTFQPVVSLMTRYGKCVFSETETSLGTSSDFYGKINVVDLDLV